MSNQPEMNAEEYEALVQHEMTVLERLEQIAITRDDTLAMNLIHEIMDGTEWSSDTTAEIADVVKATGRVIREPDEMEDDDPDFVYRDEDDDFNE